MIENRAVGTNVDIHRRKHASQGKKVKEKIIIIIKKMLVKFFFEKLIKNI